MEIIESQEEKYEKALKRVQKLKNFYSHLIWYLLINSIISGWIISSHMKHGETFKEAFFDFGTFSVWVYWGIGIVFHFKGVYGDTFLKKWEARKIEKLVKKNKFK